MMRLYRFIERLLILLRPLAKRMRGRPVERPVAMIEHGIKGLLFDCQMCGQCTLSHTGMSCPMNCPKNLRNGPCGGVRPNGNCEIKPEMRCAWVEAWRGAQAMRDPESMVPIQRPVDHTQRGRSSWLRVAEDGDSGSLWRADEAEQ